MILFEPNKNCQYRHDYEKIISDINQLLKKDKFSDAHDSIRKWALEDLFFYMHFILRVGIVHHPWLLERVYEVQDDHSNTMDLWFREAGKSTILTFGLNLWTLTKDPEQRIGIFSHTRGIAKAFLRRIKHSMETNKNLPLFFPEVFYVDPKTEALKHSEDDGLIVKRNGIYQEPSIAAYGLVDGMPTGMHFTVLAFDDVVTKESVSTPDQLFKVEEAFGLAQNLGEVTGIKRITGTNYHFNDLYQTQEKTGVWKVRRYPATDNGSITGNPVLFSRSLLEEKRRLMGPYVFSCQLLLNPVADENQIFRKEWLRYYRQLPDRAMNLYLFCDPASGRKEKAARSDFTVMWLWGLDPMKNLYLVDIIRDRLNLTGRWKSLKGMMKKWPKIQRVYYEQYGLQADIEHFESRMREEGIYFTIEELSGKLAKTDRIQKLVPLFEAGKIYLPEVFHHSDGKRDLIKEFIEEEYLTFPFSQHDDMLDAASRLMDEKAECYYPEAFPVEDDEESEYGNLIQLSDWSQRKANSRYANV
jgi:predicted phage terminase large subunit-like protein